MLFKPGQHKSRADLAFHVGSSPWNAKSITLDAALRYIFWFGGKLNLTNDPWHVPDFLHNRFGQTIATLSQWKSRR